MATQLMDDTVTQRPRPAQSLSINSFGLTDRGQRRSHNEDQFLIATVSEALSVSESSVDEAGVHCGEPKGHLFVVADGMGGHVAGERASAQAVHAIESFVLGSLNWCAGLRGDGNALLAEFQKAIKQADEDLNSDGGKHPEWRGMGTTVTLAYVVGADLFLAHAGDSRCYLLRRRKLAQLTHDHTLVQEMVRHGVISPEEAPEHNMRHVITNVVGGSDPGVDVELHKVALEPNDRLLLCSDGLTEMLADQEIATILGSPFSTQEACRHLVQRANEQGGKDNITVVVVHLTPMTFEDTRQQCH